jgi:predicted O-linked N-acetylglucosamine transferase (SPINDLY family)
MLADGCRDRFEAVGIDRRRIMVLEMAPTPVEHLAQFHQVDIALDTYPFHGCVTSLEGLWMGVPVISLVGSGYVSRVSLTILSRLGMESLAVSTPRDFVAKAVTLARNTETLARLRACLRPRMQASALCDARRFAREVEAAYRDMWRRWCHSQIRNQESEIKNQK